MMTCNFDTENLSFPVFHPIYIYTGKLESWDWMSKFQKPTTGGKP